MRILGIDPGTTAIGYAVIEGGREPQILTADCISISHEAKSDRLRVLHERLTALILDWKPHCVAVERLFFSKNVKTALSVSEARGVILLTTSLAELTVYEYTPLEVKKIITGDGRADKHQVEKMIQLTIPSAKSISARDDVFDAIGIALTCFFKERHIHPVRSFGRDT